MKRKKDWEHLNFEHRKIISNALGQGKSCLEIAELIGVDPSTISKEIKRNRTLFNQGKIDPITKCSTPDRFPHVCNACSKRYQSCDLQRFTYIPKDAQKLADYRLVSSRRGINLTQEEFDTLDNIIKEGVDNDQSIYHILKSNPEIEPSVSTVYRYIENGYMTTKAIDLPRKVLMKKRKSKKNNKKYDYSTSNPIDRSNRTYLDYLLFKNQNPGLFGAQMDFLGKLITDSKSILTLTIPDLHFVLLFLLEKETADNVYTLFNQLEDKLGFDDFTNVFPYILTDRDWCFQNYIQLECGVITGERRTHLFYCDAYQSSQKGNVENMNQQLRTYFPKKESKDHLTQEELDWVMDKLNNRRVKSLSGATPYEAFTKVYGQTILEKLLIK